MSLFITFEGGEGCGKSTQAKTLFKKLSRLNLPVLLTHEPGGTTLGDRLVRLLKWAKNVEISPMTELMLFNASRAELVKEIVQPALKKGTVVICDRFADSTIAYQSYGRGIDRQTVELINQTATQGLKPGLTILLDIPTEEGLARKKGQKEDRFQQENIAFHRRVREGYLKLAADEPERWLVIDACQSRPAIAQAIWQRVSTMLSRK